MSHTQIRRVCFKLVFHLCRTRYLIRVLDGIALIFSSSPKPKKSPAREAKIKKTELRHAHGKRERTKSLVG
jgi:hypothetical protein